MNKQAADALIKGIGMTEALSPLLRSFGEVGYIRFERTLVKSLEGLRNARPRIRVRGHVFWNYFGQRYYNRPEDYLSGKDPTPSYSSLSKRVANFSEAIDCFYAHYGINSGTNQERPNLSNDRLFIKAKFVREFLRQTTLPIKAELWEGVFGR